MPRFSKFYVACFVGFWRGWGLDRLFDVVVGGWFWYRAVEVTWRCELVG
jgi:hypothetical protein